jgi:lipid II:glycine glycyltransferase (peptidoglycan interpeptide bridge formation enzyme)
MLLTALRETLVDKAGHILRVRLPLLPPMSTAAQTIESVFGDLGFQHTDRARRYETFAIDLKPTVEDLLKRLHGKWRTDLNFAKKADLSIEIGTRKDMLSRFQSIYEPMRRKKGFSSNLEPRFFFDLKPESIGLQLMIAHKDGRDAAGHVLSILGDSAVYLFGASNELGRETKASYLLSWSALLHAKERGLSWYDLGGIDADANPGVYRFKSRMGGTGMTAIGPFEARPQTVLATAIEKLERVREAFRQVR